MSEYRFNIGDLVRVKSYMKEGDDEYPGFVDDMEKYKNKEYIVGEVLPSKTIYRLRSMDDSIETDVTAYYWSYKWLEPVAQRDSIEGML